MVSIFACPGQDKKAPVWVVGSVVDVACRLFARLPPVRFATRSSWVCFSRPFCFDVCITGHDIHSVGCWLQAERGLSLCGLRSVTAKTVGHVLSRSVWSRRLHAQDITRTPQLTLWVSCGMWCVSLGDFRLATACHFRHNKAVGHLLLASRVVLRFARPAHGKTSAGLLRNVVCRLAVFVPLLPATFTIKRRNNIHANKKNEKDEEKERKHGETKRKTKNKTKKQ